MSYENFFGRAFRRGKSPSDPRRHRWYLSPQTCENAWHARGVFRASVVRDVRHALARQHAFARTREVYAQARDGACHCVSWRVCSRRVIPRVPCHEDAVEDAVDCATRHAAAGAAVKAARRAYAPTSVHVPWRVGEQESQICERLAAHRDLAEVVLIPQNRSLTPHSVDAWDRWRARQRRPPPLHASPSRRNRWANLRCLVC